MIGSAKRNSTVLLSAAALTIAAYLLNDQIPLTLKMAAQVIFLPLESFTIVFALLVFFIGWQTYDTERTWPIALLSYLFLAGGLLNVLQILSIPTMPTLN